MVFRGISHCKKLAFTARIFGMIQRDIADQPLWDAHCKLPLVEADSELFDHQIMLGGIALVLSRLHPEKTKNKFTYTRGLAFKLTRILESGNVGEARLTSDHLRQVMEECDRVLDQVTQTVLRRVRVQYLQREQGVPSGFTPSQEFEASGFQNIERLSGYDTLIPQAAEAA